MKRIKPRFTQEFKVLIGNRHSQAAEMVLHAGDQEGDPRNKHRGAEQWSSTWARRHQLSVGAAALPTR